MFELIRNHVFFGVAFYSFTWLLYSNSGWKELVEKYRTENSIPKTFLVTDNQRIIFSSENKNGSYHNIQSVLA